MRHTVALPVLVVLFLTLFTNTTEAEKSNIEANETYIGIPGKALTLKWTYTGPKMYEYVSIYMPDSKASAQEGLYTGVKLWQVNYFASNNTFSKHKNNVLNSVFNNLTELEVQRSSVFYLKIKAVPRNLTKFEFTFRLKENDRWKAIEENKITVRVAVPPVVTITVDKGNAIHVPKGREVNIKCTATGFPVPKIEIKKDSLKLETTKTSSNGVNFKLPSVEPSDAGTYVCHASNRAGAKTRDTILTVTYIETKTAYSSIVRSTFGKTEDLKCPIEGFPPLTYSWYPQCNLNNALGRSKEISIELDVESKFGNYCCIGQNNVGLRKATFTIYGSGQKSKRKSPNKGLMSSPGIFSVAAVVIMLIWLGS